MPLMTDPSQIDIINRLPDSVANLIAAGEVIERPASVIKELIENSIDAGATSVEVIVKDGGKTLLQVVDNGKGMSLNDARMAFERHATSKISKADDLFALHTMGFRGEALASIAAVANVDMRTMRPGDSVGTRLQVSRSQVDSQTPEACVPGTNIMVKNIFSYLPARRRFLKTDNSELGKIVDEFERLALVNPGVEFKFVSNGNPLHILRKATLRDRITDLFGNNIGHRLLQIETESTIVRISGFLGHPSMAKKRGNHQFLFVNGRYMRHKSFHRVIMDAYQKLISFDCQPSYFINFEVEPSKLDVNIHPQKYEVKFEQESEVRSVLGAALKKALGGGSSIDFNVEDAPDIPIFSPHTGAPQPTIATNPGYNPFNDMHGHAPKGWEALYLPTGPGPQTRQENGRPSAINAGTDDPTFGFSQMGSRLNMARQNGIRLPDDGQPVLTSDTGNPFGTTGGNLSADLTGNVLCLKNKYLITPTADGLAVIDRFRAMVCIIYHRLCRRQPGDADFPVQSLIFPEIAELTVPQHLVVEEILPELKKCGFDLTCIGPTAWSVNGIPQLGCSISPRQLILDLIAMYEEKGKNPGQSLADRIKLMIARAAAIKGGTRTSRAENDKIVSELSSLPDYAFTPDGLPVLKIIDAASIEKMF